MVFGRTGLITAAPESEAENASKLLVYPNPANTTLTVRTPAFTGSGTLRLLNGLGRTVREQPTAAWQTEIHLSVGDLPSGFYLLQVTHGKSVFSEGVVIGR